MFMSVIYSIALLAPAFFHFCHGANIPRPEGTLVNPPASLINSTRPLQDIQIQCRGLEYGFGLNYDSCQDALLTFTDRISTMPTTIRIGMRGFGGYDQTLPWEWVSRKLNPHWDSFLSGRLLSTITPLLT